MEVLPFYTFMH